MRFVSRFKNYRHGVRAGRLMVLADGQRQEIVRHLSAKFLPAAQILTEDEVQWAIKNMVHKGLPIDRDTEQFFSPRSRISGFDSFQAQQAEGWTDEERQLVEQALLNSAHNGSDHVQLVPEAAVIPWPTYDTDSPEQIVLIAKATGLVEATLAYESENAARAEVLEGFAPEAVEAPVVVDAS